MSNTIQYILLIISAVSALAFGFSFFKCENNFLGFSSLQNNHVPKLHAIIAIISMIILICLLYNFFTKNSAKKVISNKVKAISDATDSAFDVSDNTEEKDISNITYQE